MSAIDAEWIVFGFSSGDKKMVVASRDIKSATMTMSGTGDNTVCMRTAERQVVCAATYEECLAHLGFGHFPYAHYTPPPKKKF